MERMLIEDNEEIDKDGNKEDNNNPGKMDLNDDSISDDNDDNNSSHSNIFSFGYEAKDNQVIIKYIQIFNFESFLENLSSLRSPCILINDVINKEILNIKIKQNSDNIKIPLTLFEKIKEDDIEYLMNINHKKRLLMRIMVLYLVPFYYLIKIIPIMMIFYLKNCMII